MAETMVLQAQSRNAIGTAASRQLRKQGMLPAVVYGHKEASVAISVSHEDFDSALRHGARIVDLKTGGSMETALIREVQWDPFGMEILHVDFTRVSKDEKIQVEVALELRGTSPGAESGGVLDQQLHALQIECAAVNVPDGIIVNINELQMNETIYIKDLEIPEGVIVLQDPEDAVIRVNEPVEEEEEEAEAGEEAEPEVIKQGKEDEGGDES